MNDFKANQFYDQATSVYTNTGGPAIGMLFGYWYYQYHNIDIFKKQVSVRSF